MAAPVLNFDAFLDVRIPAPSEEFDGLTFPTIKPDNSNPVTVYVRGKDNGIQKGAGYWDNTTQTWRKVDNTVIEILGWKKNYSTPSNNTHR